MTGRPQSPPVRRECRHARKHEHGTPAAYKSDWCRCDECRAACAAAYRERKRLEVYGRLERQRYPAIGAQRRLQALAVCGWSASALAAESGLYNTLIQVIRSGRCSYVNRATHLTIVALYDRLWDQQPPTATKTATKHQKGSISRAKRHARIIGWKPPMYWDDDLIDTPPASRQRPAEDLMPCGTVAAYRRHLRRGEPVDQACRDEWTRQRAAERQEAA